MAYLRTMIKKCWCGRSRLSEIEISEMDIKKALENLVRKGFLTVENIAGEDCFMPTKKALDSIPEEKP